MHNLVEGAKAPSFSLPCDGLSGCDTASLQDLLRGGETQTTPRWLVLYFYPKDDTSGCTSETLAFDGLHAQFAKLGGMIVGCSPDSIKSHQKFRAKHGFSVPLLSDESKEVLQAYGVWCEKSMYGRKYMGVERTSLLIDSDGIIRKIWSKVKVPGHAEAVLDVLRMIAG